MLSLGTYDTFNEIPLWKKTYKWFKFIYVRYIQKSTWKFCHRIILLWHGKLRISSIGNIQTFRSSGSSKTWRISEREMFSDGWWLQLVDYGSFRFFFNSFAIDNTRVCVLKNLNMLSMSLCMQLCMQYQGNIYSRSSSNVSELLENLDEMSLHYQYSRVWIKNN